nr:GDP-mannose 4,6-dehydratase [Actinomycetes bacterium]
VTRFIRSALEGTDLPVYGDGEQIRDFTFVGDVVAANLAVADSDTEAGSVFNVSGGSNCSVNEVLDIVACVTGQRLTIARMPAVEGDVRRTGGDSSLLTDVTGWRPVTTIEDGLRAQVEWVRSVLASQDG